MRSARWTALLLVLLATTGATKAPTLTNLSNVRPAELISAFNADASHGRLLVMLSPT